MKLNLLTSTSAFGAVVMITTLGLFLNGANALDLKDFSSIDQKVITVDGPKAGGIALIKEDTVTPKPQARGTGPVLTAVASSRTGSSVDYNNITPAAGGDVNAKLTPATVEPIPSVQPAATLSGRTVPPVTTAGLGGPNDSATDPTDPFAKVQARLDSAGVPSAPQPGSEHAVQALAAGVTPATSITPLVNTMSTQSMASNASVKSRDYTSAGSLQDIAPAAGGNDSRSFNN